METKTNQSTEIQTELREWIEDMKVTINKRYDRENLDAWDVGFNNGVIATLEAIEKGFL